MKSAIVHWICAGALFITASACGVRIVDEEGNPIDDSGSDGDGPGASDDGSGDDDGDGGVTGTPCTYLAGTVTLMSYGGNEPYPYNEALYSFEFATKDIDLHYNDGDVLYMSNMFSVNTVTDDRSFIVDLGDVPLDEVPPTVNPDEYPLGNWEEHDDVQVVLNHTYVIRTIDGNTDQWAALHVNALSPGSSVTFNWIRSPNPNQLDIPAHCL